MWKIEVDEPQQQPQQPQQQPKRRCTKQQHQRQEYIVDYDDYKRVTFSPDEYHEDLSKQIEKKRRNMEWIDLLLKYYHKGRQIVYLDSEVALTTSLIHAMKLFKASELHVPNPNDKFLQQAPADFASMATHYDASVYEWMRDVEDGGKDEYNFGLDYCCTFDGNNQVKPKADLTMLFRKRLLAKKDGLIWLTVSNRKKGNTIEKTIQQVFDFVYATSAHYGYNIVCEKHGSYGNGITYFFFKSM